MPGGNVIIGRTQRTFDQPTSGSNASTSACAGNRLPPSKVHALRNTPEVMSNKPSDSRCISAAKSSRFAVSLIDRDGLASRRIDTRDDVVRPIAAELVLDAQCAGSDGVGYLACLRLIGDFNEHLARAAHGAEAAYPQAVAAREV